MSPEDAGAGGIEIEDRRFVGLAVEAGLGVGQPVAGQDHLFLDQQRAPSPFGVELRCQRRVAGETGFQRARESSTALYARISRVAVRPRMSGAWRCPARPATGRRCGRCPAAG